MQTAVPQLTTKTHATTFATSSAKLKKKKSPLDDLSKDALLKKRWKEEEEAIANATSKEGSQASSEAFIANDNPYYPYNQELFGHDEESTPGLGEN